MTTIPEAKPASSCQPVPGGGPSPGMHGSRRRVGFCWAWVLGCGSDAPATADAGGSTDTGSEESGSDEPESDETGAVSGETGDAMEACPLALAEPLWDGLEAANPYPEHDLTVTPGGDVLWRPNPERIY